MRKTGLIRLFTLSILLFVLFTFANPHALKALAEAPSGSAEGDMLILTYREWPEGVPFPASLSGVATLSAVTGNGYELTPPELAGLTLSYLEGDNWSELTSEKAKDLPADARYRFDFTYQNVKISDIIASGGKMVYKGLPDWFTPSGSGILQYGGEDVGRIEKIGDDIVITFNSDWLETHKNNTVGGTFRVSGSVDWHELPPGGGSITVPDLNFDLAFENDLAMKYGQVDIDKSEPELIAGENGKYYLKYTLTVKSLDSAVIPDITVRDLFEMPDYVAGYVGVGETAASLRGAERGMLPWEARGAKVSAGRLCTQGQEMLWEIGDMQPGETRTLTYWVEIADSYVLNLINNPIDNRAKVYSGSYLKEEDMAAFAPSTGVTVKKTATQAKVDNGGNGTVSYTVTVTAGDNNSFTLENLALQDSFPAVFANNLVPGTVTVTVDGGASYDVPFAGGTFTFDNPGLTLEPGQTVTITYTVQVRGLFDDAIEVDLTNTASVGKGGRTLHAASHTKTLRQDEWITKIAGDQLDEDRTFAVSGDVYEAGGGGIQTGANPGSFTVPKGSVYYEVNLNPDGEWDLSDVRFGDALGNPTAAPDLLVYAGYIRIEQLDPATGKVKRTVWLKADGLKRFEFALKELGFAQEDMKDAFRLSYYARFTDSSVGPASVSNDFTAEGTLWGDGYSKRVSGTQFTVSNVVQGGYSVGGQKAGWYYEPKPVYRTAPVGTEGYPESEFIKDYPNGAIYWIIRLEGYIQSGSFEVTEENGKRTTTYSGFLVKDEPDTQTQFKRDSVLCAFIADRELDVAGRYGGIEELMEATDVEHLHGTTLNHKYFYDHNTDAAYDYYWFAENTKLDAILFPEPHDLPEDKALFIVLRTRLNTDPPKDGRRTYDNTLSVDSGAGDVPVNTATYTYMAPKALMKESKGAFLYTFGKDGGDFKNLSNRNTNNSWNPKGLLDESSLTDPGLYAVWLLNVNYDGSMSGTADIIDDLPEGMVPVYVDVNNMGGDIQNNLALWPELNYIQELNNNPDWKEMERVCRVKSWNNAANQKDVKVITYYNKKGNQLRWRISDLTRQENKRNEINLRIICKITNPDLFLNQSWTFYNTTSVLDSQTGSLSATTTADVTVTLGIDKSLNVMDRNGNKVSDPSKPFELEINRLPFEITVNKYGEDMVEGATLPTLVDKLSPTLQLLEETITVKVNGQPFAGFTYTVETDQDGSQLLLNGLPDGAVITIGYEAKLSAKPGDFVPIENKVYFLGYQEPGKPQVSAPDVRFDPDGDVFVANDITVTVHKVDAKAHSKKLDGAVFALYEVAGPGSLGEKLREGASDSAGEITFASGTNQDLLHFDTVYCLREEQAPAGYSAGADEKERCYYFIIVPPKSSVDIEALRRQYAGYHFDVWYDSPQYGITIANDKGSIGVDKVFLDADGRAYTPESGTYRFGLFTGALELLETIAIEYTGGGKANYYVNGVPMASPEFTRYDPDMYYHIYELDDDDQPIVNNSLAQLGNMTYVVTYAADEVSARSGMVRVGNRLVPEPGSISVSKTVESPDASDKALRFAFRIDLTLNGRPLPGAYRYTGSRFVAGVSAPDDGAVESGGVVSLSHGQTITLEPALPPDTVVTVTELGLAEDGDVPADAFLPSYTIVGSAVSTSGTGVSASAVISAGSAQGDQIHFRFKNLRDEDADVPMTGDNSHLELFVALAVLSMISMAFFRKKMVS